MIAGAIIAILGVYAGILIEQNANNAELKQQAEQKETEALNQNKLKN